METVLNFLNNYITMYGTSSCFSLDMQAGMHACMAGLNGFCSFSSMKILSFYHLLIIGP